MCPCLGGTVADVNYREIAGDDWFLDTGRSGPSELLQADRIVPDLGHVPDMALLKFHVIDIFRSNFLPGWGYWSARSRLGSMKNRNRRHRARPVSLPCRKPGRSCHRYPQPPIVFDRASESPLFSPWLTHYITATSRLIDRGHSDNTVMIEC